MRKTTLISVYFCFAASLVSLPASANEENSFVLNFVDHLRSAYVALQEGNFERAIDLNKRALQSGLLGNRRFFAHVSLCISLRNMVRLDEAESHCTKALRIKPDSWQALANRANVYHDAGKYIEAEADYRRALEINPGSTIVRENLKIVRRLIVLI